MHPAQSQSWDSGVWGTRSPYSQRGEPQHPGTPLYSCRPPRSPDWAQLLPETPARAPSESGRAGAGAAAPWPFPRGSPWTRVARRRRRPPRNMRPRTPDPGEAPWGTRLPTPQAPPLPTERPALLEPGRRPYLARCGGLGTRAAGADRRPAASRSGRSGSHSQPRPARRAA